MLLLEIANAVAFTALAILAGRQWRVRRSPAHSWFALSFVPIAVVASIGLLLPASGTSLAFAWAVKVEILVLLLFPYCLHRFANSFAPRAQRTSGVTMAALGVALATLCLPASVFVGVEPPIGRWWYWAWLLAFLGYWSVVSGIVGRRFWKAGEDQPTIVRRRMHTLSVGALSLAVGLLLSGFASDVSGVSQVTQMLGLVSGLCFFIGFAPPPLVQAYWREAENARIRAAIVGSLGAGTVDEAIDELLPPIAAAFGGRGALLVARGREFRYGTAPSGPIPDTPTVSIERIDDDTVVIVPLEVGRLAVSASAYAPFFSPTELVLAQTFGTIIDLVFERESRLRERRRRTEAEATAQLLQQALLPDEIPRMPGVDIATEYLPARLEEKIGGDWYDVLPLGPDRIGLVIGDVAGKGIAAAVLMSRVRNALWAVFTEEHDPLRAVSRVQTLVAGIPTHRLTTLVCATFDITSRELVYVSAGHLPPMIVGGESARLLTERNPPLGTGVAPTDVGVERLAPGDRLVLYTDGLVERRDRSIETGLELLRAAALSSPRGAEATVGHLLSELLPDGSGDDDTAVLVVEVKPSEDRLELVLPLALESTSRARAALRAWLDDREIAERPRHDVLLAVGEAVANAVEHAAASGSADFRLVATYDDELLTASVIDGGSWRAPRGDGRGRGLSLMRMAMDDVEVIREERGTTVVLRRRIS